MACPFRSKKPQETLLIKSTNYIENHTHTKNEVNYFIILNLEYVSGALDILRQ